MARVTGRVEIYANGELLLSKTGATASGIGLSGEANFELNEVMGDSGLHGYVENPILAQLEVAVTDRDDVSLDAFARIREDGTIVFRSAKGGKSYTMGEATCVRNFTLTSGEGETALIFRGPNWQEGTNPVVNP